MVVVEPEAEPDSLQCNLAPRWFEKAEYFDGALWKSVQDSEAVVLDSESGTWQSELAAKLKQFIVGCPSGAILVKTSTAGRRSPEHEVSPELVAFVLSTIASSAGVGRTILGDGPAVPDSYESECRRLGYDQIASSMGVRLLDLNRVSASRKIVGVPIAEDVFSAAAIVNLTKAKTHRRFGVSLGSKSLLGAIVGNSTGYPKLLENHRQALPLVLQLEAGLPNMISIIDGDKGIEGEGPLTGTVTNSHFMVVGRGAFGPDILSAVEMGFDPALVPGFMRPLPPAPIARIDWSSIRRTRSNFLPPTSCSWLYKSLLILRRRQSNYYALSTGAQRTWPNNS